MTLARCVCKLFLASPVSDMRLVKATLTLLNWFHISLEVAFSRISISSLSLWEAARSLWECRMLSSVNLDHESGREILTEKQLDAFTVCSNTPTGFEHDASGKEFFRYHKTFQLFQPNFIVIVLKLLRGRGLLANENLQGPIIINQIIQ